MAEFLAPERTDQAFLAVAGGQTCLLDLYDEAVRRGAVCASELKEIPEEEFVVSRSASPSRVLCSDRASFRQDGRHHPLGLRRHL